jgi:hypothetical protein
MSSCCTLRLNRRSAFSRDSPSCSLTSAKKQHPPTRPVWTRIFIARFAEQSQEISVESHLIPEPISHRQKLPTQLIRRRPAFFLLSPQSPVISSRSINFRHLAFIRRRPDKHRPEFRFLQRAERSESDAPASLLGNADVLDFTMVIGHDG